MVENSKFFHLKYATAAAFLIVFLPKILASEN